VDIIIISVVSIKRNRCVDYHLECTEESRGIQIIWNAQHSEHIWICKISV